MEIPDGNEITKFRYLAEERQPWKLQNALGLRSGQILVKIKWVGEDTIT